MRGRAVGIEGTEKRHLAGRETLITVEVLRALRTAIRSAMLLDTAFARDQPRPFQSTFLVAWISRDEQ